VFLGPPGTGKTSKMLDVMESELSAGTRPDRVAYITFTKKGALEALQRAVDPAGRLGRLRLTPNDLPWYRTIHSLVFRQMGYRKSQVVGRESYGDLGKKLGIVFTGGVYSDEGMVSGLGTGDRLVFLENLARVTDKGLRGIWESSDHGVDWTELEAFSRAYRQFKRARNLVDYTDMLEEFVSSLFVPPIEVLIVDEAQDLSWMQWEVVGCLARGCRAVYIAGDDDQSIYRWAGADTEQFIDIARRGPSTVLEQSYRVPSAVHPVAMAVVERIKNRKQKTFRPRSAAGSLRWVSDLEEINLTRGEWLLLARNSYMLKQLEDHCLWAGVNFDSPARKGQKASLLKSIMTWERLRRGERLSVDDVLGIARYFKNRRWSFALRGSDSNMLVSLDELHQAGLTTTAIWHEAMELFPESERDYFISLRSRGEKLLGPARIKISTIHGVKGGQADNVLLLTDVSLAAYNSMVEDADDEARCFYVGLTRARENLFLMEPQTNLHYTI
jgi:DNA helicase II / ATP-dependent DNA helicase PcrA